jgi:hypothetical protein
LTWTLQFASVQLKAVEAVDNAPVQEPLASVHPSRQKCVGRHIEIRFPDVLGAASVCDTRCSLATIARPNERDHASARDSLSSRLVELLRLVPPRIVHTAIAELSGSAPTAAALWPPGNGSRQEQPAESATSALLSPVSSPAEHLQNRFGCVANRDKKKCTTKGSWATETRIASSGIILHRSSRRPFQATTTAKLPSQRPHHDPTSATCDDGGCARRN